MKNNTNRSYIVLLLLITCLLILGCTQGAYTTTSNDENDIYITLKPAPLFLGIQLEISNMGAETFENLEFSFSAKGEMILSGGSSSGIIDQLTPDENYIHTIRPIGFGNIQMEATVQSPTTNMKRTTAEAFLFFFLTIFSQDEGDTVEYEVTFDATWSEATHPYEFPSNPHFSGLIGASHNDQIHFWREGEIASPGIKNMAETGSKNPLIDEIEQAIAQGKAFKLLSGSGINPSPGSTSLIFKVNEQYPLVSLVTMIAPSPDWFVGVDSLSLFEDGSFVEEKIVHLYAYDAGTDSGSSYTSPDEPTNPQEPIYILETEHFLIDDTLIPLGTFTFTKQ
jgi:hypothetical protein